MRKRTMMVTATLVVFAIVLAVLLFTDLDGDGLSNISEIRAGTSPNNPDTDGDGLNDGSEVNVYRTNPLVVDTDNDGLQDGLEINTYKTNPLGTDTDNDCILDGWEVKFNLDPLVNDTAGDIDNDGLNNLQEYQHGTNPSAADTDNDGMPDGWEANYNINPLVNDATGDADNDGLNNLQEYQHGAVPNNPDTDSDNLWDGEEVAIWDTDPLSISPQPSITIVPNKTGRSAILIFGTENSKSCKVKYGADANYSMERSEVRSGTKHIIIFPNLNNNYEYHYTIGASYNGGDVYSKDKTFTSKNAVNNWDNGLQKYTVNLFGYFNFDASQDNFDTWKSYLKEAAKWIYDATDGYIRIGTVVLTDSPAGDFADFDNVTDMKIHRGYDSESNYYTIDNLNDFIYLGTDGDEYSRAWTGANSYPWPPWTIAHEFGHYAFGLHDEYTTVGASFCINNTYDSSLMSGSGYWIDPSTFHYYSELCTDATHTQGTNHEQLDIVDSMWKTMDSFYPNIPDNHYTGSATPTQDVGLDWDSALSFITVNF